MEQTGINNEQLTDVARRAISLLLRVFTEHDAWSCLDVAEKPVCPGCGCEDYAVKYPRSATHGQAGVDTEGNLLDPCWFAETKTFLQDLGYTVPDAQ